MPVCGGGRDSTVASHARLEVQDMKGRQLSQVGVTAFIPHFSCNSLQPGSFLQFVPTLVSLTCMCKRVNANDSIPLVPWVLPAVKEFLHTRGQPRFRCPSARILGPSMLLFPPDHTRSWVLTISVMLAMTLSAPYADSGYEASA